MYVFSPLSSYFGLSLGVLSYFLSFLPPSFAALSVSLRSRVVVCAADNKSSRNSGFRVSAIKGSEPFHGKSGSVSFVGLSHQSVEESKLVSAPFNENTGSFLWILAPVALISSLIVPQFFIIGAIEDLLKNEVLAGILELPS